MRDLLTICESLDQKPPMDAASKKQRATELGFTVRAYHGTGNSFRAFDLEKGKPNVLSGYAPHFADSKKEAHGYADERKAEGSNAKVLDCLLRIRNPFIASSNAKPHKWRRA